MLPFALAVVLDAARAARAAAAMITVAAVPAAAVVLFVSFVTCVVVMLWSCCGHVVVMLWSCCGHVVVECPQRVAGGGSAFFPPNRPAVLGWKLPGFIFVVRPRPAMYGLGWTLGGSMGLLCGVLYVGVWCDCMWCVSIPNFDGPFLLQMIFFEKKKKGPLVAAGPIRPNPLSFSKSIGAFLPKKLYT